MHFQTWFSLHDVLGLENVSVITDYYIMFILVIYVSFCCSFKWLLFCTVGSYITTKLSRSVVMVMSNIEFNKKAFKFKSNANRLLAEKRMGYTANRFERVQRWGVGGPCMVRSKFHKFEYVGTGWGWGVPVWWESDKGGPFIGTPCEQTEWQTHTTENITFSQLRWRPVTNDEWSQNSQHLFGAYRF